MENKNNINNTNVNNSIENSIKIDYDLIIYHNNCPDGIAGAWCFWKNMDKNIFKFYGGKFNEAPPEVSDKKVLFIDFSYSFNVMLELVKKAKYLRVLDHHKTSNHLKQIKEPKFSLLLDMSRSGAQLAWDEIYPEEKRPWFIDDIADRDLWKWKRDGSKESTRAMFGLGYYESINIFNQVSYQKRSDFIYAGEILLRDDDRIHKNVCNHSIDCYAHSLIDNNIKWKARLVCCGTASVSDVGDILLTDELCDFAALFRYEPLRDEWWISLRAHKNSEIDLTDVVKHFGNGGGHPKASGFTIYGSNGHNLQTIFKPVESHLRFNIQNNQT